MPNHPRDDGEIETYVTPIYDANGAITGYTQQVYGTGDRIPQTYTDEAGVTYDVMYDDNDLDVSVPDLNVELCDLAREEIRQVLQNFTPGENPYDLLTENGKTYWAAWNYIYRGNIVLRYEYLGGDGELLHPQNGAALTDALSSALSKGSLFASVGSTIPGIGTAVGAVAGALLGLSEVFTRANGPTALEIFKQYLREFFPEDLLGTTSNGNMDILIPMQKAEADTLVEGLKAAFSDTTLASSTNNLRVAPSGNVIIGRIPVIVAGSQSTGKKLGIIPIAAGIAGLLLLFGKT